MKRQSYFLPILMLLSGACLQATKPSQPSKPTHSSYAKVQADKKATAGTALWDSADATSWDSADTPPFATVSTSWSKQTNLQKWHPIFGVDGGLAAVMNAGSSQTFDIDAISEQFFIYTNDNQIKAPALYGGFVGIEWQGDSNWMFELLIDYNQSSLFSIDGLLTQGIDTTSENTYDYSYNMRFRQLLGQVKVGYIQWPHILPYILFGLGAGCNSAQDFVTTAPSTLVATRAYADNLKISPAYIVGFGFDIPIVDFVRIGVGYRFSDLGKMSLGQATIDDVVVTGTLYQQALYANEFIVQLTFVF